MTGLFPKLIQRELGRIKERRDVLFLGHLRYLSQMSKANTLPPDHISDIIQMALSDHVSFGDIRREYGIAEKDVKVLMRQSLKPGSYRSWRKRVRDFGDRREIYK